MAALTVPPMSKVTQQNKSRDKIPVIDPRLSISSSKVPPLISVFVDVLSDVIASLTASTPYCFGDAAAEQGAILFPKCSALHDSECNAQDAQAAHARSFNFNFQAVEAQARPSLLRAGAHQNGL